MKKNYPQNLLLLAIFALFSSHGFSQCSLAIAGDTTICAGDSVTLTANAYGATASISTVWLSNNGGSAGGINLFDLTVAGNNISISSMDINTSGTVGPISVDMYTRVGTYVGFTGSSAGWTLVGTATGPIAAGTDLPTPVTFASPVILNASTTYGIALVIDGTHSFRYTNGTGGNQAYSDANLSLALGAAGNVPWTTVFTPRVWNGTFYYSTGVGSLLWSTGDTTTTISVAPGSNATYSCIYTVPSVCTVTDSINIVVESLPVVNLGNDTALCNPAVFNLDAGNPGSLFAWNLGDTTQTIVASSSGNYSVIVTNPAGCSSVDSIDLTFNNPPAFSLGNDTSLCSNDFILLDAGAGFASYLWNNGDPTQATNIPGAALSIGNNNVSVTVTDGNSCSNADTINVLVLSIPSVNLGTDIILCPDGSTLLDAGAGFNSYSWSSSDITQTVLVNASTLGIGVFNYSVTVGDTVGCFNSDTVNVTVISCAGIDDPELFDINIYPNPTTDQLNLSFEVPTTATITASVVNELGEVVSITLIPSGTQLMVLSLKELSGGMYWINFQFDNHHIWKKVVKTK